MSRSLTFRLPDGQAIAISGWRPHLRAAALLVAVLLAYHYSLATLLRGIGLETPLAYLALVPVIALILAWVRLTREPAPIPIHDRQVDYIVGVTLLAIAMAVAILAPPSLSTSFWLNRYDLLGLPFFVAGLIAILYGLRRLWALKVPIGFLFLAWPVPYAPLVGDGMRAFADLTAAAAVMLSAIIPTASPVPGDPSMFFVGHGSRTFAVSIGSACSGVNSLVGFILVGGALAYAVRGPARRRVAWLAGGLVLIWLLNVLRIEAIFAAGAIWGQDAAMDILHPVAGLIVFNVGVLAMLLATDRLGLSFMGLAPRPDGALRTPSPVRVVRAPIALAAALAILLGVVNAGYARYETIAGDFGTARLVPFDIRTAQVPGWSVNYVGRFDQARQFFGSDATWDRIQYSASRTAALVSSVPIYVDVINTNDSGALAAYGLEACYRFHGYRIEAVTSEDLGNGIVAQVVDYHNTKIGNDWTALWWEWPYTVGTTIAYERIVLFVSNGPRATYAGYDPNAPASSVERFQPTDRFLFSLAHAMVQSHLQRTASR
jgi:exosortase